MLKPVFVQSRSVSVNNIDDKDDNESDNPVTSLFANSLCDTIFVFAWTKSILLIINVEWKLTSYELNEDELSMSSDNFKSSWFRILSSGSAEFSGSNAVDSDITVDDEYELLIWRMCSISK